MQYDNTPTVVAVLVFVDSEHLLVVRRNNEPGKGLLGLPGGYHMRGETWQEAGAREVLEETGYAIDPESLNLVSMVTDEYGNNLVIAMAYNCWVSLEGCPDGEVQEVLLLKSAGAASDWAFPRHYAAAVDAFL